VRQSKLFKACFPDGEVLQRPYDVPMLETARIQCKPDPKNPKKAKFIEYIIQVKVDVSMTKAESEEFAWFLVRQGLIIDDWHHTQAGFYGDCPLVVDTFSMMYEDPMEMPNLSDE